MALYNNCLGKEIGQLTTNSSVRTCGFSYSANLAVFSTDKALGHQCEMFIMDVRNVDPTLSQEDAISRISVNGPRISAILWGAMDETIITGHEDGEIKLWDVRVSICISNHSNDILKISMQYCIVCNAYRREKSCPVSKVTNLK